MTDGLFAVGPEHLGATLRDRYIEPPLSVLNRAGDAWRTRKRQWLALGIQSELGRDAAGAGAAFDNTTLKNRDGTPRTVPPDVSIFDPVLCELAYTWWCPPGGRVIDNFCGGSVRGLVAAKLGLDYTGIDLSWRQVDANKAQGAAILGVDDPQPRWMHGDAVYLDDALPHPDAPYHFAFTCPPYYDLEVYSDDPSDLSAAKTYAQFLAMYRGAIAALVPRLLPDAFAGIVVGDVRDKRGHYQGLVADTIDAYNRAGMRLYNEIVVVDPYGTAPQRAAAQFPAGRKVARVHQVLLLFVRGDWKRAAAACAGERVHDVQAYDYQQRLFDPVGGL